MKVGNNETNSLFTIEFVASGQFSLSEIKYYCQVPVRRLSTGLGIKDSNMFKVLDVSGFIPGPDLISWFNSRTVICLRRAAL